MDNTAATDNVPDDCIERTEPHCQGSWGRIAPRRKSIRDVASALSAAQLPDGPEFSLFSTKLAQVAQAITQGLWQLFARLEEHERSQSHIQEETLKARQRVAELPPFNFLEPREIANARQGAEKLCAKLGEEAREEARRWLEARAEIETSVAEQLAAYCESLSKVEVLTQKVHPQPTLSQVLRFMEELPAQEVFILAPPREWQSSGARLP